MLNFLLHSELTLRRRGELGVLFTLLRERARVRANLSIHIRCRDVPVERLQQFCNPKWTTTLYVSQRSLGGDR
jgi:hypothetical protein